MKKKNSSYPVDKCIPILPGVLLLECLPEDGSVSFCDHFDTAAQLKHKTRFKSLL